ncbi:cell division protein ZapA [Treponema sp.]|uniref:cell division protein ZapA n=1 Tax=Treponema sp. TaxID=166 RepID=UPI00388D876C
MGSLLIDLFDCPFSIRADEDNEYLEQVLSYYKKIVTQIQRNNVLQNPLQISALAGVMLCDELYKEKSKTAQLLKKSPQTSGIISDTTKSEEAEKIANDMIEKINRVLNA